MVVSNELSFPLGTAALKFFGTLATGTTSGMLVATGAAEGNLVATGATGGMLVATGAAGGILVATGPARGMLVATGAVGGMLVATGSARGILVATGAGEDDDMGVNECKGVGVEARAYLAGLPGLPGKALASDTR